MEEQNITIIYDLLKEYLLDGIISTVGVKIKRDYRRLYLILLDGFGRKEFRYLARNSEYISSKDCIPLINPHPNTKMAYKQIFQRGNETINNIVKQCEKKVLVIDNKEELSTFSDDFFKELRKNDRNVFHLLKKKQIDYDVLWVHIMGVDHAHHSQSNVREKVREIAESLDALFPHLLKNSLVLLFGDHGPHDRPYSYNNKVSAIEKRKIVKLAYKIRKEASRTNLVILER